MRFVILTYWPERATFNPNYWVRHFVIWVWSHFSSPHEMRLIPMTWNMPSFTSGASCGVVAGVYLEHAVVHQCRQLCCDARGSPGTCRRVPLAPAVVRWPGFALLWYSHPTSMWRSLLQTTAPPTRCNSCMRRVRTQKNSRPTLSVSARSVTKEMIITVNVISCYISVCTLEG